MKVSAAGLTYDIESKDVEKLVRAVIRWARAKKEEKFDKAQTYQEELYELTLDTMSLNEFKKP